MNLKQLCTALLIMLLTTLAHLRADDQRTEMHLVKTDKVTLETRITYPPEGIEQTGIVLFSRGSGHDDMSGYFPGFRERFVEQVFLPRGFAVIYQNKRGIGKSTGNWKMGSIEQRANDLSAVADYYASLPNLNSFTVGVVGHSQGGWVAQYLAADNERFDFAISLAGPAVSVAESDIERTRLYAECEGLSPEEIDKEIAKRERHQRRMLRMGGWFPFFEMRFMKNILPFESTRSLSHSTMPVLMAFGGLDAMVPADSNVKHLNAMFPQGLPRNVAVIVDKQADHFFRVTDSMCIDWERLENYVYSETFYNQYTDWIDSMISTQ